VRTAIACLEPEVEAQLSALDARRADIARRYIERLRLQPYLGHLLTRGVVATEECRAVYAFRVHLALHPIELVFGHLREEPLCELQYRRLRIIGLRQNRLHVLEASMQLLPLRRSQVDPRRREVLV
jgi:hypothetical protein